MGRGENKWVPKLTHFGGGVTEVSHSDPHCIIMTHSSSFMTHFSGYNEGLYGSPRLTSVINIKCVDASYEKGH